jgi:hypothetical protein
MSYQLPGIAYSRPRQSKAREFKAGAALLNPAIVVLRYLCLRPVDLDNCRGLPRSDLARAEVTQFKVRLLDCADV